MSDNRVATINNSGKITALVKHSHIKIQNVCKIDRTFCCSLIRTDCHHMIAVNLQILETTEETLDKLISRTYGFKTI